VDLSSLWGEVDQPQPVAFLRAVHVRRLVRQRFTALARSGPEIRHAAPHTRRCAGHPAENPTRLRLQDPVCGLQPRKDGFRVSFALRRWLDSPRIVTTVEYGPRWRAHVVRVRSEADLDDELMAWLQEAHDVVGMQTEV